MKCSTQHLRSTTAGGARRRPARPAAVGEDVLVDTLLLARAAFLLKSVSAVGEFAVYWSEGGRLLERSYDFNLQTRQPVPRWVGALAGAGEGAQQSYSS